MQGLSEGEWEELLGRAQEARAKAYAKYSKFTVGAALLAGSRKAYLGANVENVSYGLTMCAERVALGAAIVAGEREFVGLALCSDAVVPIVPCGACRQVLAEFCSDLPIFSAGDDGKVEEFLLSKLLPKPSQGILG